MKYNKKKDQKSVVKEKPMDFFQLLKIWFRNGLLWYAVISLMLLIAGSATGVGGKVLDANQFLLMFPFGLCMSAAGLLFSTPAIKRWLRVLGHYVITVLAFLLFIFKPAESEANPYTPIKFLYAILILTVVYWILFALVHLFKTKIKKLFEE